MVRSILNYVLTEKLLEGLERLKNQYGTPQAESVRRAIAAYLTDKGMTTKPAKPKAARRQRKK